MAGHIAAPSVAGRTAERVHGFLARRHQPTPVRRCARGDAGLTTLEWLLVVAAVAGLAALAVVVVQNVVDGTAEDIASHSARQEAAQIATLVLTERWQAESPDSQSSAERINRDYSAKCRTLGIIYGDIDVVPEPAPGIYRSGTGWGQNVADQPSCNLV